MALTAYLNTSTTCNQNRYASYKNRRNHALYFATSYCSRHVYGIVIFLKCQNSTLHCVRLCLMLGRDKKISRPRQSNCALICFCSVTKKLFSGGCYHSQLISAAATLLGGQPMTKQGSVATRGGDDTNKL